MSSLLQREIETPAKIENIVATGELEQDIDLEILAVALDLEQTEYEPEQFPSLIYHDNDYTILVFSNGKFICTGLTGLERVNSVMTQFKNEVQNVLLQNE